VLLEIDLQGARQIRAHGIDALFIFLAPPSFNALVERLEARGTENDEERRRRLATAVEELSARDEFDEVVINDVVETAASEVVDLISRFETTQGDS
jgi:guanylate kinase